ncbi:MAG: Ig-like domain-containing protein [Nitrososphaerota archaeon]
MRENMGFASVITTLIITAVVTAMMAVIGSTVISLVQETMPREVIPAFVVEEGNESLVELINPSMVSVDLSKLEVIVGSSRITITDENGDGIWSPGEKVTFRIPSSDYAMVEVYYDKNLIYKAIFLKPLPIYHDNSFPFVNLNSNSVEVTDDTAVIALHIYAGYPDSERLIYSTTASDLNKVLSCYDNFRKTGTWDQNLCGDLQRLSASYAVVQQQNSTNKTVSVNGREVASGQIYYLRFVAHDVTGKTTSVILTSEADPVVRIESITSNQAKISRTSENTWTARAPGSAEFLIRASAVDDSGLKEIAISVGSSSACLVSGTSATCEKSFGLSTGYEYGILATAKDVTDRTSSSSAVLRFTRDLPPNVTITPSGGVFMNRTITVSVSATDDFNLVSIEIRVNGNTVRNCTVSGTSATCSATVTLNEGANTITAIAKDDFEQSAERTVTVTYQPPIPPKISVPEVSWQKTLEDYTIVTS